MTNEALKRFPYIGPDLNAKYIWLRPFFWTVSELVLLLNSSLPSAFRVGA